MPNPTETLKPCDFEVSKVNEALGYLRSHSEGAARVGERQRYGEIADLLEALSRRAAGDDVGRLREAALRIVELAQNEGVATGDCGRAAWGSAVREIAAALTSTSTVAVGGDALTTRIDVLARDLAVRGRADDAAVLHKASGIIDALTGKGGGK